MSSATPKNSCYRRRMSGFGIASRRGCNVQGVDTPGDPEPAAGNEPADACSAVHCDAAGCAVQIVLPCAEAARSGRRVICCLAQPTWRPPRRRVRLQFWLQFTAVRTVSGASTSLGQDRPERR